MYTERFGINWIKILNWLMEKQGLEQNITDKKQFICRLSQAVVVYYPAYCEFIVFHRFFSRACNSLFLFSNFAVSQNCSRIGRSPTLIYRGV